MAAAMAQSAYFVVMANHIHAIIGSAGLCKFILIFFTF
jgi:hypothetical protein